MIALCRIPACCILIASATIAAADDSTRKITSDVLRNDQLGISGRYDRFERLLSQMADILGHEDPERSELLRRAVSRGREKAISRQLNRIAEDLGQGDLGRAAEQQSEVLESLSSLLQLLRSEDRRSELEKERERLNKLLRDVRNTLNQQRTARAGTQNSAAPSSSAPGQQKALDQADKILENIEEHDGRRQDTSTDGPADADSEQSGSDGEESSDSDDDAQNAEPDDPDSADSDAEESDQQGSLPQNSRSKNGSSQQQDQQTPGREQIANARQFMQQALKQLQEQLRDRTLEKQDGAIDELLKAVEELQERLLQLREEEKEMILASLEARFQRMLALQTQIYDETVDLDATPVDKWLDTMFARSREVAHQQTDLQLDCEQSLRLLQEDGTSVAIVLSVEDIAVDMQTIARRLRDYKVSTLTQTLETDIIEALQELIEATQREMQEMKSEERQEQSGEMQKPPLVDLIAEIRVLRSLQLRINRRTSRIDGLLAEQDADSVDDLHQHVEELAKRQDRLVKSAAELSDQIKRRQQRQ